MKKQILISLGIVFAIILVLGLIKFIQISNAIAQNANFSPPPEAVTSIEAKEEVWRESLFSVGSVSPVQGVILSAEEPGKVVAIHFDSGTKVNQGDLLVELDTGVEEGNLKAARARESLANKNLTRMQSLKKTQAVSQNEVDLAVSRYDEALGEVLSLEGIIARKKIVAPFSGKVGIRLVNLGQHVESGTEIVPLYSLDKIYIDFTLPQQAVAKIKKDTEVNFTLDVYPGEIFKAKVSAINPQIDQQTRNIKVQAVADNPEEKLRPGMFVKVEVLLDDKNNYIAIPASSINFAPYGNSVYVIENMKGPNDAEYLGVRQQIVQVGSRRGEQIAVLNGVKPGHPAQLVEDVTRVLKRRNGTANRQMPCLNAPE